MNSTRSPGRTTASDRARELVLRYGWNPTVYQILNPGIELWFSGARDAVAGYVDRPGIRVVAGNPVCARARMAEVVVELEEAARAGGRRVCYLGADDQLEGLLRGSPRHSSLVVGAQPVVVPAEWPHTVRVHASLRAQLNRARNKGVEVREWFAGHATNHPALARCLTQWLDGRGLPPLHFLVEPDTLGRLADRCVFVAERGGDVVGFLVASPIPLRRGWQIEQLVRCRAAPNGTMELLVDGALKKLSGAGIGYVALGAAPLSRRVEPAPDTSPILLALLAWQRAHARRFYDFAGLERFKAKFRPREWQPVYAISTEARFSVGTLYGVAGAYCGGSPLATGVRAVARAMAQELRWLKRRVRPASGHG